LCFGRPEAGAGQRLIDVEQGWTLDHEGLALLSPRLLHGRIVDASRSHGTRVLGLIAARAPGLDRLDVVSHGGDYDELPSAIACAARHLDPGHVLLLEVMDDDHLPIERRPAVWRAVRRAVDSGIVVIEPAGNAGSNLDGLTEPAARRALVPGSQRFEDSGAILVGCCEAGFPGRLVGCNYGARVDCHEVGEGLTTLDSDCRGDRCGETDAFGRSSAAAALVAATVVVLQSAAEQVWGRRLMPAEVRDWLRDPAGGRRSAVPVRDRIGPRPMLDALLALLRREL